MGKVFFIFYFILFQLIFSDEIEDYFIGFQFIFTDEVQRKFVRATPEVRDGDRV